MKLKNKEQKALYKMLSAIADYSYFMDNYFTKKENIEEHKTIYEAYNIYSKDLVYSCHNRLTFLVIQYPLLYFLSRHRSIHLRTLHVLHYSYKNYYSVKSFLHFL